MKESGFLAERLEKMGIGVVHALADREAKRVGKAVEIIRGGNLAPLPISKPQHWSEAFMRPAQLARCVRSSYNGGEKSVAPPTIRKWIDEGKIRAYYLRRRKVGKKMKYSGFLIPLDECERVIAHGPIASQLTLPGISNAPAADHITRRMEAVI